MKAMANFNLLGEILKAYAEKNKSEDVEELQKGRYPNEFCFLSAMDLVSNYQTGREKVAKWLDAFFREQGMTFKRYRGEYNAPDPIVKVDCLMSARRSHRVIVFHEIADSKRKKSRYLSSDTAHFESTRYFRNVLGAGH